MDANMNKTRKRGSKGFHSLGNELSSGPVSRTPFPQNCNPSDKTYRKPSLLDVPPPGELLSESNRVHYFPKGYSMDEKDQHRLID